MLLIAKSFNITRTAQLTSTTLILTFFLFLSCQSQGIIRQKYSLQSSSHSALERHKTCNHAQCLQTHIHNLRLTPPFCQCNNQVIIDVLFMQSIINRLLKSKMLLIIIDDMFLKILKGIKSD